MNEKPDPHSLLEDVLSETAPAGFREDLLRQTLGEVRHRKRLRTRTRNLIAMALALSLPVAFWRLAPPPGQPPGHAASALSVVRSEPLRPGMVVETRASDAGLVTTSPASLEVVETERRDGLIHEITDAELLALAAGRPAALVRWSPRKAELVFLSPSDQEGFPAQ